METIKKIFIVDDHRIFREGLVFLISQLKGYEIAGEACNGIAFLKLLDVIYPDIVLMDITMPGMDGIEASTTALMKFPDLKIIILTMSCDPVVYHTLMRAGVSGFILKESGKEELKKALDAVNTGQKYYSQKLLQKMITEKPQEKEVPVKQINRDLNLTASENEVLQLLCQGCSINYISEKLSISIRMVEACKNGLMAKTGSKNPVNLAVYAMKNNLVDI